MPYIIFGVIVLVVGFLLLVMFSRDGQQSYLVFSIYNLKIKNNFMLTLKDNQNQLVGISGAPDSKGQPTTVTEAAVTGSNDAAATFSINADGKLQVSAVADGTTTGTVTAKDADGNVLTQTIAVTVVSQDATAIVFTPETPTVQ